MYTTKGEGTKGCAIPFCLGHSPDTKRIGAHFVEQSSVEREAHSFPEHNLQWKIT